MTNEKRLRLILAEARDVVAGVAESGNDDDALRERIDALLAEPSETCGECEAHAAFHNLALAEARAAEVRLRLAKIEIERLTLRIATLEGALAQVSLTEYESTSSASEKVHAHARIARRALYGEKA